MWRDGRRRRIKSRRARKQYASVRPRPAWSRRYARLAKLAFFGVIIGAIALVIALPIVARTLPSPENVIRKEGFSTKILDRNGEVLYDIFADQRRTQAELEDVPEYLRQATISIEDKNFYSHSGYDPLGMLRGVSRIFTRGYAQGGSTLTQQLVKNTLLTPERSVLRKIREFILAVQIESKFSKDEILEFYLNEAPYGGTAWGVEAAAETYFGKNVNELGLVESAFLAGLPQRPSVYSPYSGSRDAYIGRTGEVLRRMREDGHITRDQEQSALDALSNLEFLPRGAGFKAPHFVQYVQNILEERYGEAVVQQGGLAVTTTLDLALQEAAQEIVTEEIAKVENLNITNGAAVALDPETGEILAMVGSKDFDDPNYDGQVNVTLALRQPGSAIKPVIYATGLEKGYTASSLFMDVPTSFPGGVGQPPYEPANYDGEHRGPVQLRLALGNSINIPAVKMLALVGIEDTLETAYNMGLESLEPSRETLSRVGLSLALGGGEVRLLELTSAYSVFANEGHRVEPVSVLKVVDASGKVLEERIPKKGKRVLSGESAFLMADILSDNSARELVFGANSLLNIPGRDVLVKTGTTNDKRDNWAVGGTSQVMVGVWVGNNDNSPMKQVASGVSGATPIWRRITIKALEGGPVTSFARPDSVVTATVDAVSGYRAHDDFAARTEFFAKGTEPGEDPVHLLQKCGGEEKEVFIFKEEDPTTAPGEHNLWQEGVLAWVAEQNNPKYNPSEICEDKEGGGIQINFKEPADQASNLPNDFTIEFSTNPSSDLEEVYIEVEGERVRSFTDKPYRHNIILEDGIYEIKAVVKDKEGNTKSKSVRIGVGVPTQAPPQNLQ